ncbi:hypothetical protein SLE2022_139000 [Rubroshorea leprosula]
MVVSGNFTVQNDHFEEFFACKLDKYGYQALYKRKTSEVYGGNPLTIDGCATFFHRDRFSHVEFNKAAQSLIDFAIPSTQKKAALNRLVKDSVALIVVLEAKFTNQGVDNPDKRQLLCVANTHVNVQQDLKDVKIWQVHTLFKRIGKNSCQCRHSNVGMWGFQFCSWKCSACTSCQGKDRPNASRFSGRSSRDFTSSQQVGTLAATGLDADTPGPEMP